MNAPQWIERYSGYQLVLAAGTITVTVIWTESGYRVLLNGARRLKASFTDLEAAKEAGIDMARRVVQYAAHELNVLRMASPAPTHEWAAKLKDNG